MITLSYRQPWATLVSLGIKPIENRTWKLPEKYKGKRVLIHASGKPWSWYKTLDYIRSLDDGKKILAILDEKGYNGAWLRNLPTSAIIGSVIFTDSVINHPSVWAEKNTNKWVGEEASLHELLYGEKLIYNWVCESPVLFDKSILNVRGKLNFWESDVEICHICGKPTTKEHLCDDCDEYYCEDCSARYNQFSQIDYNCCKQCAEKNTSNDTEY